MSEPKVNQNVGQAFQPVNNPEHCQAGKPDLHVGIKKPIELNYRQAVNLFGLLDTIKGDGFKAGAVLNAIGSIWQTVGLQIDALEKDKYGEPIHVQDWKPEF